MAIKGVHKTPHTAVHKHKWVHVVMLDGEAFTDRFMDRTPKHVFFKKRGKVTRGYIKSFTLVKGYKMLKFCSNCIMDGTADELVLDANGVCNFCHTAQRELKMAEEEKPNLAKRISEIKLAASGSKYDVLIGLSGGADSSTLLIKAVELGLRPLTYSIDNGWNDPKADENIMRLVEGLKVPFYRYIIDLARFRDLQTAFLKAGQKNLEIPTDHILMASSLELAAKYGIKWILSGGNVATESIMPASWGYNARDLRHIRDVYRATFHKRLTGLPLCGLLRWNWYKWVKGIKTFYLLDYLDYNRSNSIKMLEERFGYKDYHEKHCESIWTWWFQNFYLFEKFSIDKRKAHYSSMINSGQMTRKEAMDLVADRPIYPDLGLEERALSYPKRPYTDFKTDEKLFNFISKLVKAFR
jgi:N-acetyl sugar amidotransferase